MGKINGKRIFLKGGSFGSGAYQPTFAKANKV